MLKLYKVTYKGLWLGGRALVFAASAKTAVKLVATDKSTTEFTDVTVEELDQTGVVYNDNGDY